MSSQRVSKEVICTLIGGAYERAFPDEARAKRSYRCAKVC